MNDNSTLYDSINLRISKNSKNIIFLYVIVFAVSSNNRTWTNTNQKKIGIFIGPHLLVASSLEADVFDTR